MRQEIEIASPYGLSQVPPTEAVGPIAHALRSAWGIDDYGVLDLDRALAQSEIEVRCSDLGGAEGGPQGLLIPLSNGGFRIEVDPAPPEGWRGIRGALRDEITRHRMRFVIAHELAHTLFYWRGRGAPERIAKDSESQELFCDALASALLVPRAAAAAAPLRPESVVALHNTYDVSMEVAARALIAAYGDGVGWLMVVPANSGEAWVQWGAERSTEAIGPWKVLMRIMERVRRSGAAVAEGRLRWHSGRTTVARGLLLPERRQLVVTARAA
jgi:hypothetical protein